MAQQISFDREILRWITKNEADTHPTTTPVANLMLPAQGYAVAMVRRGDDLSDLEAAMQEVNPGARVVRLEAPESGNADARFRTFLDQLLEVAGLGPLSEGADLEQAQAALPGLLYPLVDFLVIDAAERLPVPSLHALRRHKSMPPTILISYDTEFLGTLSREILLMRNVYFFQTEAGPAY
ncbi:MAG TPA: hypothetical protein VGJ97_11480 [Anaerolineaceae bacterium]